MDTTIVGTRAQRLLTISQAKPAMGTLRMMAMIPSPEVPLAEMPNGPVTQGSKAPMKTAAAPPAANHVPRRSPQAFVTGGGKGDGANPPSGGGGGGGLSDIDTGVWMAIVSLSQAQFVDTDAQHLREPLPIAGVGALLAFLPCDSGARRHSASKGKGLLCEKKPLSKLADSVRRHLYFSVPYPALCDLKVHVSVEFRDGVQR